MGGFSRSFGLAGACLAVLLPSIASANDRAPLTLAPTSQWHVTYADDSCRLTRTFGEGADKSAFFIERYEPGDQFFMLVAGRPLDRGRRVDPVFRFGPDGYEYDGPSQPGNLGEFSPAMMVNGMRLVPSLDIPEEDEDDFDPEEDAKDTNVFGQEIPADQEAAISWLEIRRGSARPIRLELGSMGPPMAAMRKCTDELLTHWGIDLEAHRGLTRAVAPQTDPARWVRSWDYPKSLLRRGAQGIVQFRLSVGPDGLPTQCHIQKSTRPEGFDKAVCNALMRRAKFDPALDAGGRPIASFWRNTVRFVMP